MRLSLLFVLLIVFVGCKQKWNGSIEPVIGVKKPYDTTRHFYPYTGGSGSTTPYTDTLYGSDTMAIEAKSKMRYFHFAYSVTTKDGNSHNDGDELVSSEEFPNFSLLQDYIFSITDQDRSCFQKPIITSIYEFKSKEDYVSFMQGFTTDKPVKQHVNCPTSFDIIDPKTGTREPGFVIVKPDSTNKHKP